MSKREIENAKMEEWFLVFVFVIVDASILFVSFTMLAPKEDYFVSDLEKYGEKYCNSDIHIVTQLSWAFILLVLNSAVAIKARHLPENFKETRVVVFASMSCVIVGNVIWLSFFQRNYYWKTIFLFYSIFSLNCINFMILYGYKVYILIFVPEKNTKKHFNLCTMAQVQKQAERIAMNKIKH